jgi:hypothetical protein
LKTCSPRAIAVRAFASSPWFLQTCPRVIKIKDDRRQGDVLWVVAKRIMKSSGQSLTLAAIEKETFAGTRGNDGADRRRKRFRTRDERRVQRLVRGARWTLKCRDPLTGASPVSHLAVSGIPVLPARPHARNYLLSHRGVGPSFLARGTDLLTRRRIARLCSLTHLRSAGRAIECCSQFRTCDRIGPACFRYGALSIAHFGISRRSRAGAVSCVVQSALSRRPPM